MKKLRESFQRTDTIRIRLIVARGRGKRGHPAATVLAIPSNANDSPVLSELLESSANDSPDKGYLSDNRVQVTQLRHSRVHPAEGQYHVAPFRRCRPQKGRGAGQDAPLLYVSARPLRELLSSPLERGNYVPHPVWQPYVPQRAAAQINDVLCKVLCHTFA